MTLKPRVAVIGLKGLPAYGGAARVGENLLNGMKHLYEFTVYETSSHSAYSTGRHNGIMHHVFKMIPNKKLNTLYYYIRSCLHAFFKGNYDLIHLHHRDASFVMLLLRLRFPVLLTTHGSFSYSKKWKSFNWFFALQEYLFVRLASQVVCVSKNEVRQYARKARTNALHIPNGINLDEQWIKPNDLPEKEFLIFAAGRIIASKGLDVLLKSIKKSGVQTKLIVLGDMEQTPDYKNEIILLANGLDVEFRGLIKDKSLLLGWVSSSKLFVFPSSKEAMSMMLLEAASVKTPIISSNIIENKDIFPEDAVLYFNTNDVDDLSEKLVYALNEETSMKKRAENAHELLIKDYLWNDISEKYILLYQKLIKKMK